MPGIKTRDIQAVAWPAMAANERAHANCVVVLLCKPAPAEDREALETIHVIGGASVYDLALSSGVVDLLLLTHVQRQAESIETDTAMTWPLPADSPYQRVLQGVREACQWLAEA